MNDDIPDASARAYPKEGEFGYPHSPWSAYLIKGVNSPEMLMRNVHNLPSW